MQIKTVVTFILASMVGIIMAAAGIDARAGVGDLIEYGAVVRDLQPIGDITITVTATMTSTVTFSTVAQITETVGCSQASSIIVPPVSTLSVTTLETPTPIVTTSSTSTEPVTISSYGVPGTSSSVVIPPVSLTSETPQYTNPLTSVAQSSTETTTVAPPVSTTISSSSTVILLTTSASVTSTPTAGAAAFSLNTGLLGGIALIMVAMV